MKTYQKGWRTADSSTWRDRIGRTRTHLRDADAILIFGPGEAKVELKTRLERRGVGAHVIGIEAADKMTQGQISAKVRQRFAPERSQRVEPGR